MTPETVTALQTVEQITRKLVRLRLELETAERRAVALNQEIEITSAAQKDAVTRLGAMIRFEEADKHSMTNAT